MERERDQSIVIDRRNGMTYAEIGRLHGLTDSRVLQICQQAAAKKDPWTPADELTARVRNALDAEGCKLTPEAVRQRFTSVTIKRVPNLGALSIQQINEWLVRYGQKAFK